MSYQLPSQTDELWRRTRPDTFGFPESLSIDPFDLFRDNASSLSGVQFGRGAEGSEILARVSDFKEPIPENDFSYFILDRAPDGYTLYVEPGKVVEIPLELKISLSQTADIAIKNRIILGENSSLTIVESAEDAGGEQLLWSTTTHLKPGANLKVRRYFTPRRRSYFEHNIFLEKDASASILTLVEGDDILKFHHTAELAGEGAEYRELFADDVRKRGHVDATLNVHHNAPNTLSRIEAKGVVRERGYSLHHGLVTIPARSAGSDTNFSSRHLLLSPKGRADSIPKLMIDTDDVRAGHGATVGNVDEEAIFYLMTRGVARDKAVEMIVEGFLPSWSPLNDAAEGTIDVA